MLPIEEIIPFIRHEDPLVAKLAIDCLENIRWPGRLTGDFLLEVIADGHSSLLPYLNRFEISDAILKYAIDDLKSPSRDRESSFAFGVIDQSRDALFTPGVIAEIRDLRIPMKWVADGLRMRLEMMNQPTEYLRREFLAECEQADAGRTAMSEHKQIRAIADRLTYRGDSIEWAHEQLAGKIGSNGWAEIWLFALLIKAEDRSVLPIAAKRFPTTNPDDNESLTIQLTKAMSALATPNDIPLLANAWEHCLDREQGYFVEGMAKLRFPEAEPFVLDLARHAESETVRSYAAAGLCEMIATNEESIEFVRNMVENRDFDTTFASLEELAIPLGIILGRPFPEEAGWRARLTDKDELRERRTRFLGGEDSPMAKLAKMFGGLEPDSDSPPTRQPTVRPKAGAPIAPLKSRKIGRNDPCPCASGKKFKKCCGGK
jgi:hypothetical protein